MKTLLFLATLTLVSMANAAWLTNYDEAVSQAKAQNKPILVDFTGSDWCGWCIKLDKEIFSKAEFESWAAKKVVLLKLDFPRKAGQSAAEKAANAKLSEKYGVQGFPTILVIDATGKELGRTGYKKMSPTEYTKHLEQWVK